MIASLRGVVQAIGADHAVLDVGGVGYLVQASGRTLGGMAVGGEYFLLVETQVRADAITLWGFADAGERDWFRLLLMVQGVGGRVALSILGVLAPNDLGRAIAAGDKAMLQRAPGVGARLAARILTELKGKGVPSMPMADGAAPGEEDISGAAGGALRDAISALEHLGFRPAEAARAVEEAARAAPDAATSQLIRAALRLAQR